MAATRADRSSGNYTVFENGVYTACAPCKDDPKKPPLWQVKAARIIHNQTEKMLYFEDARLEFFGVPMAYLPYFSTPDPTVKRKTGFLMPSYTSTTGYGFGVDTPFYWALAPDYDMTITPRITTRQGVLGQVEFRTDTNFGFAVPVSVDGVDGGILDPRSTWADKAAYDAQAEKLVSMFIANFAKFENHVDGGVRDAAPGVKVAAE